MRSNYFFIGLISLLFSCSEKEGDLFADLPADKSGISFANTLTESEDQNILDYMYFYNGGGVAIGDINNDGLADIFFSGNQVKNKLYLNKGNLEFEDISEKANITGNSTWNTGVTMADVNGDGLLDIYVCAVVGINGFNGHNELFINNGDGTFTESAEKYGIDFDSYSSSAVFFDYDLDGDLDLYLLNHAIHTQESYGRADLRNQRTYATGDKLLRNDGGIFTDVSEEAGIFGGVNGYGLGISIADFNQDGWPDIYVGNDFHEDDYYYINNQDGTFAESLKEYFGHTSKFSMGNDVADLNHDGFPDLITLDMLAEDEKVLKASEGDENSEMLSMRTERLGYHYQYPRNMLQVNQNGQFFSETGLLSGIEATDWSWGALFADYDLDGKQDLFISNGIPKRPNDLDYIKFLSNDQIRKKINNTNLVDKEALALMPSGNVHNFIFKGERDLKFEDMSGKWIRKDTIISTGVAYGDLDNDGDLDIVTNNINSPATLYINKSKNGNYLKLNFKYKKQNVFGVGTKVFSYSNGTLQYKELFPNKGFQSSSEPIIHFGYGSDSKVDSLVIVWPDKSYETLRNIQVNQTLEITPGKSEGIFEFGPVNKKRVLFEKIKDNLGIDYTHQEDSFLDFNAQKLIPYKISDRGPATAVGDLNMNGKNDIYFGSSKYFPSAVYEQRDTSFVLKSPEVILKDSINEDVSAIIGDFSNNSKNDLLIGTAGGNFYGKAKPLLDKLYLKKDSFFLESELPLIYGNSSVIKANDFDKDGDLDLFIGSNAVSYDFGNIPTSYLLTNSKGKFSIVKNEELSKAGMVTDAVWTDFDKDGWDDLVVVGEWMSPTFFKNNKGKLEKVEVLSSKLNGLWQAIIPFDIDNDGDIDYILGNWGTNTRFEASEKSPLRMYYGDFDNNGSTETILASYKNGEYYTLEGLDGLSGQMSSLMRKKFTSYKSFAGKTVEEVFSRDLLKKAQLLEVQVLESGYLKNENGSFTFVPFESGLQVAPLTAFVEYDFDSDGKKEILVAGNYFGVKPYHGRFDGFPGALIKNEKEILSGHLLGLNLRNKSVRHLNIIEANNQKYLLVTVNNGKAEVYSLRNYKN
ncbi:FG-GAP-like repeat-containing protein [Gillisia sp. Q332]|uniref:VCBS repeat-containing protein n=1 Tax=Gillisia xinjiangensis TaxID=3384765 RepID=UPI003919800D